MQAGGPKSQLEALYWLGSLVLVLGGFGTAGGASTGVGVLHWLGEGQQWLGVV